MGIDDQLRNKAEELGGQAKEAAGKLTDDEQLEAEGKGEQLGARLKQAGEHIKEGVQDAGERVKDVAEDVTEAIKDRFDKR